MPFGKGLFAYQDPKIKPMVHQAQKHGDGLKTTSIYVQNENCKRNDNVPQTSSVTMG